MRILLLKLRDKLQGRQAINLSSCLQKREEEETETRWKERQIQRDQDKVRDEKKVLPCKKGVSIREEKAQNAKERMTSS